MNSNDQDKIEAIKKKYKEMATLPKRSRFAEFGDGIRDAGNLVGHVLAVFLGVIFVVIGINFLRVPVNYIVFGDKVSATIIDYEKKKIAIPNRKHSGSPRLVYIPIVEFHHKDSPFLLCISIFILSQKIRKIKDRITYLVYWILS